MIATLVVAQATAAERFAWSIAYNVLEPIIYVLMFLALIVFVWGIASFFLHLDDMAEKEKGKRHMLWGIAGLFVMFAISGIVGWVSDLGDDLFVSQQAGVEIRFFDY